MRVVLDNNVLISALLFPGGAPETLYRMALEGRVELVSSPSLLAELARVLGDKFEADSRAVEQVVAQLALISTTVNPQERVSAISDDPSDDRVLEAALAGNATIVVSGTVTLLKLREWRGIRILDPATFLQSSSPTSLRFRREFAAAGRPEASPRELAPPPAIPAR